MLNSDEGVMPKHNNTLVCRCAVLIGSEPLRLDDYFIALMSGAVE